MTEPPPAAPAISSVESLGEEAYGYVSQLVERSPRYAGSPGEARSVAWLKEQYEKMGLAARTQDFPITLFSQEKPRVTVLLPTERAVEGLPLSQSASAEASGELRNVNLGRKEDIPADGLKGRIALVERGQLTFSQKAANMAEAGVAGIIIYNNAGGLFFGTLSAPSSIPAISISREDGLMLKELLTQGKVEVRLFVKWQQHTSQNVIGTVSGKSNKIIVVGAHFDAVIESPGARDNASGTAVVLTVARQLAKQNPGGEVRFIAFGAEEDGLVGSNYYASNLPEEEKGRIIAMINLDVVGSNVVLAVEGDTGLKQDALSVARSLNIELGDRIADAPSDHLSFLRQRVPAVIISTPDFSLIHTPQDALSTINRRRLGEASVLVVNLINQLFQENAAK
ncbi:MAG: M28 family peptidase [Chloroflexi bacterium]|nr:M28 family peptidase [Chloroflexota bacterium]